MLLTSGLYSGNEGITYLCSMKESVDKAKYVGRTVIEVAFIMFLFYANLLMGEYTKTGKGRINGMVWAVQDIFTFDNFTIAIVAALIGHLFFGAIRKTLQKHN